MKDRPYNAPNLTFLTDRLTERGWVERVVDPADRRSRVIVLTEEGRRVRDDVLRTASEGSPLAALTEDELRRLEALLARAVGSEA